MSVGLRILRVALVAAAAILLAIAGLFAVGATPYHAYVVESASMAPQIPTGSVVIVDTADQPEAGDVISFRVGEGITTHRLLEIQDDGTLVTKGDANRQLDPFVSTEQDIIGPVVGVVPGLGFIVAYLQSPAGLASLAMAVVAAALLLSLATGRRDRQDASVEDADIGDEDAQRHLVAT